MPFSFSGGVVAVVGDSLAARNYRSPPEIAAVD